MAISNSTRKTTKHEFFKEAFDALAVNGAIGDPNGSPAYAYIRVSSDEQADRGRSGLPRQIEHIHEKALDAGYCIPWDHVFPDDYTGFELKRPGLDQLRNEYHRPSRRARIVVAEDIDRLARDSDVQGFLFYEMRQAKVEPVLWEPYQSDLERKIRAAIAQEEMTKAKKRMAKGTLDKAKSGRVITHFSAYGYRIVDEEGKESERAKRFSYYALHDDRAEIVRLIYQRVASGETMQRIADHLNAMRVEAPRRSDKWSASTISAIIKNTSYKGDYIAHRWYQAKLEKPAKDGLGTRTVINKLERPESEWIHIAVPTIVDESLWQTANDVLLKNKQMARRNAKQPYLLTGLVRCADCGYSYNGTTKKVKKRNERVHVYRGYICHNRSTVRPSAPRLNDCHQGFISAYIIEDAVWSVVCNALLTPDLLLKALHDDVFNEKNASIERQIAYLEKEIANKETEDQKLYKAFMADVFDENEYADRRRALKAETVKLNAELNRLYPQRVTKDYFESQKALILQFAQRLRSMDAHVNPPFDVKQKILKMLVDQITVNVHEKWFRLEGTIRGMYAIENVSKATTSATSPPGSTPTT